MNAIAYAINNLRHIIPQSVLQIAFSPQAVVGYGSRWRTQNDNLSIDAAIREKVIEGRVNIDCNLVGGTMVAIDLRAIGYEQVDNATRVFRIPYEFTGGRRIVSVKTLNYITYHGVPTYHHDAGNSQMLSAAMDLYRAVASMPIVSTANCQIIGDNVVMVRDDLTHLSDQLAMTCLVENDEGMNNLNPGIFPVYGRLVELATKAYIYTHANVAMDQGVLNGGVPLGRIREVVDSYADANEMYQEYYREAWRKASFTNDRPRMNQFIASMVGRGK